VAQPREWEVAGTREVPATELEALKKAGDIFIPQRLVCRACVFGGCPTHPGDTEGYPAFPKDTVDDGDH
jgi:hypothetical protein